MPREGYAIHFNTSLAHNVLHHEYLGSDENHDDGKTFHTVLVQVIRFSHKDTHTYTTDKFRMIAIWHSDSLLFIKWRWIIIKVFLLAIVTLRRLRTRRRRTALSCCLRGGRGGEGGKGGRKGKHVQYNIEIHNNFF